MIQFTINFKDENNDCFNVEFRHNDTIIEFAYKSIFFINLFNHDGYLYLGYKPRLKMDCL